MSHTTHSSLNRRTAIDDLDYMPGFGNEFETETVPDALPHGQNSPQVCNYGLYAEQLSGTAFTAPRAENARTWFYRVRPSVRHVGRFSAASFPDWCTAPHRVPHGLPLGQLRWGPVELPMEDDVNFVSGMHTMTTAGDTAVHSGLASHVYAFNASMVDDYCFNADGEMLLVPESGDITLYTEAGILNVAPLEIAVIPRGMIFKVLLGPGVKQARGYVCENYGNRLSLPERGPIGANGLANPRDFLSPVAAWEDKERRCRLIVKWCGEFHTTTIDHSPLDVVAWHGNYAPYKYDLNCFSPVGSVLFDHPDPSIFTVLTSATSRPGTANVDFVIFPPRWMVAEDTFRPPWYHRNIMSEFMGLITGQYDAKEEGFVPGGMSLHNLMLPHGPDTDGFDKATASDLAPVKLDNTMAFMFESFYPQQLTRFAATLDTLDTHYPDCWAGLERRFNGKREPRG